MNLLPVMIAPLMTYPVMRAAMAAPRQDPRVLARKETRA